MFQSRKIIALFFCIMYIKISTSYAQIDLSTDYFKIHIDKKGFITSMKNITVKPFREFSINDKPSPLMCLYNSSRKEYYKPEKATLENNNTTIILRYANGSVATVAVNVHKKYFKFTLQSLTQREGIDDIQWGSFNTSIINLFGDVIGVARDTTEAVNYAIGVLALNDITIGGNSITEGDAAPFQYVIHTPDAKRFPLPASLHEGQLFPIGGNGISDVAFYSHPEEYYRIQYGNTTTVDNKRRISFTYHSKKRSQKRDILFSLIPFLKNDEPNHQEVQRLP